MESKKTKNKIKIELTDFMLHARTFRPAQSLNGAVKEDKETGVAEGRLYSNGKPKAEKIGRFKMTIPLPIDVLEKLKNDEAEIVLPEGGLFVYMAPDAIQKSKEDKKKKLMHMTKVYRKR